MTKNANFGLLAALFAVAVGFATGRADGQESIVMKDGSVRRIVLLQDDGQAITVRAISGNGEQKIAYADLSPRTVYRLRAGRTKESDAEGQLALGEFAIDEGLIAAGKKHLDLAVKADPTVAARALILVRRAGEKSAEILLARAEARVAANDLSQAERLLATLLTEHPESEASTRAQPMLDEVRRKIAERDEAEKAERLAKMTAADRADFEKSLAAVGEHRDAAKKDVREGLMNTKSLRAAATEFESAIARSEKAERVLVELRKKHRGHADEIAMIDAAEEAIRAEKLRTYLYLASLYAGRQSYSEALKNVDRALAQDPQNAEAKAARARIELEQAYSSASKYRRGN